MNIEPVQVLTVSSRKRRIAAFLIDHFVITFLMVALIFLILGPGFMDNDNFSKFMTTLWLVGVPGFLLYFAKDSIRGISAGRWIMGIMVRDADNPQEVPSPGRLAIRNLFLILWPVEFIALAVSPEKKRLGDKSMKTVVVKNPNKAAKLPRVLALVGVGLAFFVFSFLFAGNALKNSDAYKIAVKEIEHNEEILEETGGIKGYGMMPKGNISIVNGRGEAQLEINVTGNKKDITVNVFLTKEPHEEWKLVEFSKE
ncbi:RDD family protein [Chryseolinea soli]|uniref:RDD family protein n=1 Tax=Chryseolinea soli TaxID=2321403 RepID=A0A385SVZ0_9BACT|nr:cytochrome c oxidase assembly factor Coa1 family protein [Chryseolinea soli]AYB35389.1 RDD family protein [Chryseolinea soli]